MTIILSYKARSEQSQSFTALRKTKRKYLCFLMQEYPVSKIIYPKIY